MKSVNQISIKKDIAIAETLPSKFYLENTYFNRSLENIHKMVPEEFKITSIVTVEDDQDSWLYSQLYNIDPFYSLKGKYPKKGRFIELYDSFVKWLAEQIFNESLVYQKKPTLRVHLVKNKSVGGYHRDSDYNHPKEEFNVWVPLTLAHNTATINVEKSYKSEDFVPFNSKYGEFAIFDGCLKHGNVINIEKYTRLSFDFRVIRKREFREINKKSFTQNIEFSIGNYYSIIEI